MNKVVNFFFFTLFIIEIATRVRTLSHECVRELFYKTVLYYTDDGWNNVQLFIKLR